MIDKVQPVEIDFEELQLEEVIGVGGFGKVYRYLKYYKILIIQLDLLIILQYSIYNSL